VPKFDHLLPLSYIPHFRDADFRAFAILCVDFRRDGKQSEDLLLDGGDGQNGVWRDTFFADEPGDAAGDDAGLARAGSGKDKQGSLGGLNGGALFGIQVGELRLQDGVQAGRVLALVYRSGRRESRVLAQQCVSSAPTVSCCVDH
jgi:hypothetical protein